MRFFRFFVGQAPSRRCALKSLILFINRRGLSQGCACWGLIPWGSYPKNHSFWGRLRDFLLCRDKSLPARITFKLCVLMSQAHSGLLTVLTVTDVQQLPDLCATTWAALRKLTWLHSVTTTHKIRRKSIFVC